MASSSKSHPLHPERLLLQAGDVIYEPGQLRQDVYFPDGALVSLVYMQRQGHSCEVCHLGRNSLLGLQSLLGPQSSGYSAIVQQGGMAWRLPARHLQALFDQNATVRQLLLQHLQNAITQISQLAVCHRHHSLEQQLARLLLQFVDNSSDPRVRLTHGGLGALLGVRREGITHQAKVFASHGLIHCGRGFIEVLEPRRLALFACECLTQLRKAQAWLNGLPAR